MSAELVREIMVAARPETVFAFLVDPEKMARWMGVDVHLDATPGGAFRCNVSGRAIASGEYVDVVPNERVVLTWGWEEEGHPIPPGSTTVDITLTADGDKTLVRLVHRGLPEGAVEIHGEGWDHYLKRLAVTAAGGDPGRDPWTDRSPPATQ
jgi:uncharacterized protein YndB with AHSA1/START domain